MGFNYAKERRKFEAEWRNLRREYEQAGMDPDTVETLYRFDLDEFRSRRRYETWTQPMPDRCFPEDHVGAASWLDTIEDPTLLTGLRKLTQKDLKLLQFLVLEGHTQEELAQKWHCSQSSISKRFLRIKKFLRNFPK